GLLPLGQPDDQRCDHIAAGREDQPGKGGQMGEHREIALVSAHGAVIAGTVPWCAHLLSSPRVPGPRFRPLWPDGGRFTLVLYGCTVYGMASPRERNLPLKGRGALSNPTGRFERQQREAVDDGWYQQEVPDFIPTSIEPDRARSIITRNDSPDIPFEQSINPYRGCSHSCPYCIRGDTPILMGDGSPRPIAKVNLGSEIYGTV